MTTQIRTLRENVVKALSGIKEDNVSIAGIAIYRKTLLEALKLQTEEVVTLQYGKLSWEDGTWDSHSDWKGYAASKDMPRFWHDRSFAAESALQITCGRSVMRFLNRPKVKRGETTTQAIHFRDGHSEMPKAATGIPVDTRELLGALQYVLPCIATEESRPVLCCVCFDCKQEVLTLVTADGFRLGRATLKVKGLPDMRVNVNSRDILRLIQFLKAIKPQGRGKAKEYPEVCMAATDKMLSFSITDKSVDLPTVDGTFPAYDQLIPKTGIETELIASDMYEAVKALVPYCKDSSGIIRMEFKRDELLGRVRISARSEEFGESATEIDAGVSSDCKIAANYRYLLDVLGLCGDNKITFRMTTPSSPMVFVTSETRLTCVMPMFVQWQSADVKPEPAEEPEEEIETPEDELEPIDGDPRDLVEAEEM